MNILIVLIICVRMAQLVSTDTLTMCVNVLMVSLEFIVKHVIIVIIKTAVLMVNVGMGTLLILAIVNRNTKETTVNLETTVIVAHVNTDYAQKLILDTIAFVFQDIQEQIVTWLIIAITNIAHITVPVISIMKITNVNVMAVI